jgi:hypothetical protein
MEKIAATVRGKRVQVLNKEKGWHLWHRGRAARRHQPQELQLESPATLNLAREPADL